MLFSKTISSNKNKLTLNKKIKRMSKEMPENKKPTLFAFLNLGID